MKPFCSGTRADVGVFRALQGRALVTEEINPYFFSAAVAPYAVLRGKALNVPLAEVIGRIATIKERCDVLLIEGVGGLMVPLGHGYFVLDLIAALGCEVLLGARNKLGTINHTLLSTRALRSVGVEEIKVVLCGISKPDDSCKSNQQILEELIPAVPVLALPYLGGRASSARAVTKSEKKIRKTLARLLG
jgi:dethiobiotin synthase